MLLLLVDDESEEIGEVVACCSFVDPQEVSKFLFFLEAAGPTG